MARPTITELRAELAEARDRVKRLEEELHRRKRDDYPPLTVCRLFPGRHDALLIKLAHLHGDAASETRPASSTPVWIDIHKDFSGYVYNSLEEVKEHWPYSDPEPVFIPGS